jgi:catechol 2,3-dioxygenase-like lactoylglutathione lyase family enzyme
MPNTLIFVDLPSADPETTADFYRQVMGWEVEGRPAGIFHRAVPGGEFPLEDGTPSGVGHLHLGIYSSEDPRPDPNPPTSRPTTREGTAPAPRVYLLVDDRAEQGRILDTAAKLGATILWRDRYWREFEGWHGSFRDPWGTQIVLWTKPADESDVATDAPY